MEENKELRIVFRKGTEEFAEYLETLLEEKPGVDASVWSGCWKKSRAWTPPSGPSGIIWTAGAR